MTKKMKEDVLKSNDQLRREKINQIYDLLNQIKYPVVAEVWFEEMKFTTRNQEFWKKLKEHDEDFYESLNKIGK